MTPFTWQPLWGGERRACPSYPSYPAEGKSFSLHHTLALMDLAGNVLATVNKQIISLTPKFHITRHGQEAATVRKKLISPFVDRFTVDIPGPDDLACHRKHL